MAEKVIKDDPRYQEYQEYMAKQEANGNSVEEVVQDMTPETDSIKYIEQHYPETAKEFKRLQNEQYELFCKKQMDYGPSNIAMGTDLTTNEQKRLSLIGLIVRINDKVQRLINLVIKNNREAQNEPTIDAFKDLACYGIIAQIVQNGKWGK